MHHGLKKTTNKNNFKFKFFKLGSKVKVKKGKCYHL